MLGTTAKRWLPLAGLLVTLVCGVSPSVSQVKKIDPLLDSGLVETTGLTLMLLDVEVLDEEGRPVPGLTADDFTVRLDGKPWPIYSLDDLCPQPEEPGAEEPLVAGRRPDAPDETAASPEPAASAGQPPPDPDKLRYALYFDFSRLTVRGRAAASREARRWVLETMQPGDEALVAAYSTGAGLKQIVGFTGDKQALLEAIDETSDDVELFDPYSDQLVYRMEDCCARCGLKGAPAICCTICCPTGAAFCDDYGWDEFRQSRYSLKALQRLLSGLAEQPGRKAVLFFQQNVSATPQRMLGIATLDHVELIEEIGADATQARASLSTVFSGEPLVMQPWIQKLAVNLGANLADYTGGSYNRGPNDLKGLVDSVGRGPDCIYRIGLEPPDPAKGAVYTAKVALRDRSLPYRYRVQYLTESEKWWRKTLDVLDDPRQAKDVGLVAALVPARASGGRWDLEVQVALDVASLELLDRGGEQSGEWEVGALLVRGRGYAKKWEMHGRAGLVRTGEGRSTAVVLHRREITGLQPGTYELRAFARDKWADLYGGGSGTLVLPEPGKPSLAGPLLLRAATPHVLSTLPLRRDGAAPEVRNDRLESGPVPIGDRQATRGETLELRTWICPGAAKDSVYQAHRYVSTEGQPLFPLDEPRFSGAGDCVLVTDTLDTSPMPAGLYTYHLVWAPGEGADPEEVGLEFGIAEPDAVTEPLNEDAVVADESDI